MCYLCITIMLASYSMTFHLSSITSIEYETGSYTFPSIHISHHCNLYTVLCAFYSGIDVSMAILKFNGDATKLLD